MIVLEIAVDSVPSALFAAAAGADRLEVCGRLDVGGVTPSFEMFKDLRRQTGIPLFVMIRCREGSFEYEQDEVDRMVTEIEYLKDMGANGFVSGPLTPRKIVDQHALARLLAAADPLPLTFHRAFDRTVDRFGALAVLRSMGVTRVLSSGGADAAERGLLELQALVTIADQAITIMPGGGVRPENVKRIVEETGATEVHSSGRAGGTDTVPKTVKELRKILTSL